MLLLLDYVKLSFFRVPILTSDCLHFCRNEIVFMFENVQESLVVSLVYMFCNYVFSFITLKNLKTI